MTTCNAKHTLYQPNDDEWKCPKCGRGDESFWIDGSMGEGDCELLHNDDEIVCFECGYRTTGRKFASAIQKRKNLVKCPCCKGTGLVDGSKVNH